MSITRSGVMDARMASGSGVGYIAKVHPNTSTWPRDAAVEALRALPDGTRGEIRAQLLRLANETHDVFAMDRLIVLLAATYPLLTTTTEG